MVLEVVDSLENFDEEASTVQVTQAATPNSTSVNTMAAIDQSCTSKQTENAKDDNTQIEPVKITKKRDRCDDSESMNENACIHFNVEGVNTGGDEYKELGVADESSCDERTVKKRQNCKFDEHFDQLIEFKNKFGHCNVPCIYAEDPSLGHWCANFRYAYCRVQKGLTASTKLSVDRFERLEKIGFKWKANALEVKPFDEQFDKWFDQLKEFKHKFGHSHVPQRYIENPALGAWCSTLRYTYKNQRRSGQEMSVTLLSAQRIVHLQNLGFDFVSRNIAFDKHVDELVEFKNEFGHCNVPHQYSSNLSLGQWCSNLRKAYKQLQKGQKANMNLSVDRIECLENIGFKWSIVISPRATFDERFNELVEFKNKFGHCNVPCKYAENMSLASWCVRLRAAYIRVQKEKKPKMNLSAERIERLDQIGFKWREPHRVNKRFDARVMLPLG